MVKTNEREQKKLSYTKSACETLVAVASVNTSTSTVAVANGVISCSNIVAHWSCLLLKFKTSNVIINYFYIRNQYPYSLVGIDKYLNLKKSRLNRRILINVPAHVPWPLHTFISVAATPLHDGTSQLVPEKPLLQLHVLGPNKH